MNTRKPKHRSRPVPLDVAQSAVAIFAASLGYTPRYLPTTKAARKTRTVKLTVKRDAS